MPKSNKVKIPSELLFRTIYLLERLYVSQYDETIKSDYNNILVALTRKKQSIELKQAYEKIVCAPDEGARLEAQIKYLQHKRDLEIPF